MTSFSGRARGLIIVVAAISLIATVVGLLYGQQLRAPETIDTDTFTDGPIGHRALAEYYEAAGDHVLVDREGRYRDATAPVMFLEPLTAIERDGQLVWLDEVLDERASRGLDSIVVLPKWTLDEDGRARRATPAEVEEVLRCVPWYWVPVVRREDAPIPETAMLREWTVPGQRGERRVALQERQVLEINDTLTTDVLVGSRSAALVVRTHGDYRSGEVIVVSDADLLHNYNLARGDHARLAQDLLEVLGSDAVVIDEVFHGHGFHRTLGMALGRFPAVLIVVQALVVLLLFALAGARRFGVTRPPPPDHRSTEALLELATRVLLSRQRSRRITHSYVMRVLEATANELGVPPSRTMAARARGLDKLADERGVEGGAVELADAFMNNKRRSARAHVELARRAYRLRQRLLARRFAPPPRTRSQSKS